MLLLVSFAESLSRTFSTFSDHRRTLELEGQPILFPHRTSSSPQKPQKRGKRMNSSETFPIVHSLCWWHPRSMTPSSFLHLPKEMKEREYRQKIFEKMSVGLPIKLDNEMEVAWNAEADFRLQTFCFVLFN